MLMYHNAPTGKVIGCSLTITLLHGRLLEISVS